MTQSQAVQKPAQGQTVLEPTVQAYCKYLHKLHKSTAQAAQKPTVQAYPTIRTIRSKALKPHKTCEPAV